MFLPANRLTRPTLRRIGCWGDRLRAALHPADGLILVLVLAVAGLRLLFLLTNQLQLSADEMHYWDWSRRLDLAYYSKGPVVALLIAISRSLVGDGQVGVRLPALLLGALFVLLIYGHARSRIGPWNGLALAGVVQLLPLVAGLGLAMTTDPPVLVCWTVALMALAPAVRRGSLPAWLVYGLAAGIGVAAKYTSLLLPFGLLLAVPWLACTRPLLRRPAFWCGQLLALAGLVPLLVWNARHGWVNLAHNAGHLGVTAGFAPAQLLLGPLELVGGQLLLFGPITAPLLLLAVGVVLPAAWRRRDPYPLLLAALAALLLLVCALVSLRRTVYANWPLPAGLIAILLLVEAWPQLVGSLPRRRWLVAGTGLNALLFALALLPFYGVRLGLAPSQLPTRRLVGWQELAAGLQRREPQRLRSAALLLTDRYTTASALAHGLALPPGTVFTVALGRGRMNQYDLWARQDLPSQRGAHALIVLDEATDPAPLRRLFERLEPLPPLQVTVQEHPFRRYQLFYGHAYNGLPLPQPSRR